MAPASSFQDTVTNMMNWIISGSLKSSPKSALDMSKPTLERKAYYERGNGNFSNENGGGVTGKMNIFRIKPYMLSKHSCFIKDTDRSLAGFPCQHFPCDKFRIFGRAISNAQPFEMVDIQLSRQSI